MNAVQDAVSTAGPPTFRVCALLEGHADDVRGLVSASDQLLFSCSRDSTARKWVRSGSTSERRNGWELEDVHRGHEGFVNSICWLPFEEESTEGLVLTGGQDGVIDVFSPSSSKVLIEFKLLGHTGNVCALHTAKNGKRLVSGSWDFTARSWSTESWTSLQVLSHNAAVWDVLIVEAVGYEDSTLTACADNLIRLWKGSECKTIFKGHTLPVRALSKVQPDGDGLLFASASNDESIRLWNLEGDAITVLRGHDSYIYSLVSIPTKGHGGLASSGENGIICVWNEEDGELDQKIEVPTTSVWNLSSFPNGDLACACSDNQIWIFTRDESRIADANTQKRYEDELSLRRRTKQKLHSLDVGDDTHSDFHPPNNHLHKDGTLVDHRPGKMIHEGIEYDYVFSIDVEDGKLPLKLPYNNSENAAVVAEKFVELNKLPASYTEQIEEFILRR